MASSMPSGPVYSPATAIFVVLYGDHKTWQTGAQSGNQNPAGRPSCCFQPPSQDRCRSRNGWPSPTRFGRPGRPKARSLLAPRARTTRAPSFGHVFMEKIEGIDFAHKVEMGIRKDRYKAMVPQVVAPP